MPLTRAPLTDKKVRHEVVTDIDGKSQEVLKAFEDCKDGNCSCKTSEYEKVESFEVITKSTGVELSIKTKNNDAIDSAEIEKCMEHTKKNLSQ